MSLTASKPVAPDVWTRCIERLASELPLHDVEAWLKPLQARTEGGKLSLFAPNAFVLEEVRDQHLPRIRELAQHFGATEGVELQIGSLPNAQPTAAAAPRAAGKTASAASVAEEAFDGNLDAYFTFENFVEGRSNALARASALLAAQKPGAREHNPLLLYGSTGLGKTHLMVAAGNEIRRRNPAARVLYMRANVFYTEFIESLKKHQADQFKRRFHNIDALLIDDVQLFAGKERSQEEFFHTFNMLFDTRQQIIMTSDRYPKEVEGLEPRLKSRLNSGLAVGIEPPDFETRALIVLAKARERGVEVPEDVAMMIAKRMHSNVRELEGALNTLVATANLKGQAISMDFALETLRDLFRSHQTVISVPNIQKVVADYYDIQLRVMLSATRKRSIARARQMAMALARELTDRSLPEIGEAFGRDHSTVMNACKVINSLRESDAAAHEDWEKLMRKLSE